MKDEEGKVIFDDDEQAVVDKIVQERLARVKAEKPEDYEDLQEISTILEGFGYSGTPSEKKAAIKAYQDQLKQQQELDALEEMAEEEGLTPAQAKRFKALEDKLDKSSKIIEEITGERQAKKQADEDKQKQQDNWNAQVTEFNEAYDDVDLTELNADADFIEYAEGRTGTLKTIYEGYVKFTSKLKDKTADEIRAKYKSKELLSTGTGNGSKAEVGDYGLTERQKQLAKESKIPYKEYADLLKHAE